VIAGSSSLPIPPPANSSEKVTREFRPPAPGSTLTVTSARIGPSVAAIDQVLGGSNSVISEVKVRSAPAIRRTMKHLEPTAGGRPSSVPPVTMPDCHSPNREGSLT
jgi:hypothetical protein